MPAPYVRLPSLRNTHFLLCGDYLTPSAVNITSCNTLSSLPTAIARHAARQRACMIMDVHLCALPFAGRSLHLRAYQFSRMPHSHNHRASLSAAFCFACGPSCGYLASSCGRRLCRAYHHYNTAERRARTRVFSRLSSRCQQRSPPSYAFGCGSLRSIIIS